MERSGEVKHFIDPMSLSLGHAMCGRTIFNHEDLAKRDTDMNDICSTCAVALGKLIVKITGANRI
jgi:hypothetical protein